MNKVRVIVKLREQLILEIMLTTALIKLIIHRYF